MFFFQATGYNTIISNITLIFRESKFTMDEHVATGVTGGVIVLSCVLALGLSKWLPRKALLMASATGTGVNLCIMGAYYYLRRISSLSEYTWVPLVCMMAIIACFMLGYGAVTWTVMAELLPTAARGNIYPFAVAFSWVCNFGFYTAA